MTITKRTVPTFEIKADSRIQVKEWNQVIETTQDEDGNDVIRVIESIPHTSVIDPVESDYDEKVKALGEKLLGKHQFAQESKIRATEGRCRMAEDMCVKHCETIAAQSEKILELKVELAALKEPVEEAPVERAK